MCADTLIDEPVIVRLTLNGLEIVGLTKNPIEISYKRAVSLLTALDNTLRALDDMESEDDVSSDLSEPWPDYD